MSSCICIELCTTLAFFSVCSIDRTDTFIVFAYYESVFHWSTLRLLMLVCLGLTLCDAIPAVRQLFASHSQILLLCCDCMTVCLQATDSSTCTLSQQRCFYVLTKVHCSCYAGFYGAPHCKRCTSYSNSICPSVCLSVRPFVHLSHAGIVSKRRHVARCSLHWRIAKCV